MSVCTSSFVSLTEAGHWEGDLIICKRTRPVLVCARRSALALDLVCYSSNLRKKVCKAVDQFLGFVWFLQYGAVAVEVPQAMVAVAGREKERHTARG